MCLKLFHAHRNAPLFGINFENPDFHLLARRENVSRLIYSAPANIADVQQRIHSGLNAYFVRRRYKFAVGDQPHLVRMRNDPLRIGRGEIVSKPQRFYTQLGDLGKHRDALQSAERDGGG